MIPREVEIDVVYDVIEVDGNIAPAIEWCVETFGPPGNDRWFMNRNKFYFRYEKDAMWFELRW